MILASECEECGGDIEEVDTGDAIVRTCLSCGSEEIDTIGRGY